MNLKDLESRIWGQGTAPSRCINCKKRAPDLFFSNRRVPEGTINNLYLCRACFLALSMSAIERQGYAILDIEQMVQEAFGTDPYRAVTDEQRRKQRDWYN